MASSANDAASLVDRILLAKPKFLSPINGSGTDAASISSLSDKSKNNGGDTPIFSKRKMTLRIPKEYTGNFLHLAVCKNWLVCLLAAPEPSSQLTLFRFFLLRALPPEGTEMPRNDNDIIFMANDVLFICFYLIAEIALEKYLAGYKVGKLFLDFTGHHILISLIPKSTGLSADFLYIHGNSTKVRRIEKFKDHEITSVAFNYEAGTESSTGPILLGTSKGLIFETELTLEADRPSYRKQVCR